MKNIFLTFLFIMLLTLLHLGCENRNEQYYLKKAEEIKAKEKIKKDCEEKSKFKPFSFARYGGMWTEEYDGHDYILMYIDRGGSICHSASCKKCNGEKK